MKTALPSTKDDIRSLIPHSGDMVLLDSVSEANADSIRAELLGNNGHLWQQEGAPENCPSLLLIEYGAQAAAIHAALQGTGSASDGPAYIGAVKKYRALKPTFSCQKPVSFAATRLLAQASGAIYEVDCHQDQQLIVQFRLILNRPTTEH